MIDLDRSFLVLPYWQKIPERSSVFGKRFRNRSVLFVDLHHSRRKKERQARREREKPKVHDTIDGSPQPKPNWMESYENKYNCCSKYWIWFQIPLRPQQSEENRLVSNVEPFVSSCDWFCMSLWYFKLVCFPKLSWFKPHPSPAPLFSCYCRERLWVLAGLLFACTTDALSNSVSDILLKTLRRGTVAITPYVRILSKL